MQLKKLFDYFLSFVFHFIPRDEHLWLTGKASEWYDDFAPPMFFDNSKYFFLYLVNKTNEKVYWVSSSKEEIDLLNNMGLPVVKYNSLKGHFLVLRAKYFFHHYGISQINPRLQYGAIHLDFWHGTPLKKIRYDVVPKPIIRENFLYKMLNKNSKEYLSSTSEYLSDNILERAFDLPADQMMNFGYPRLDVLKLNKEECKLFCEKYSPNLLQYINEVNNYSKILLYMPTWRDDDPEYFNKANINFDALNDALKNENYCMYFKLHPLTKKTNLDTYSNIKMINNDVDIYPFLVFTDILVTDYSSIYFDYLVLNKEIVFIPYDYENYVANRELYFDYNTVTPGNKYSSFDEFISHISDLKDLNNNDFRLAVKNKFYDDYNFDSCENIYKYIKG